MSVQSSSASKDAARLTRWVEAGGTWRLVSRTSSAVTIAMLTCDGGEEMERWSSSDPAFVEQVSGGRWGTGESGLEPASEERS